MKFEIIGSAGDLNLLTIDELRVAAGLEPNDDSKDAKLEPLGLRVSSMITSACLVASDGVHQPTLLLESCLETFRLKSETKSLHLSRRPVQQIVSVTQAGTVLTEDVDFEVDAAAGTLTRLSGDSETCWTCGLVQVEYDAGYGEVPDNLKALATQLAQAYWIADGADPQEKMLNIPGLIQTERWVDTGANPQMPKDILDALADGGFVNRRMVL